MSSIPFEIHTINNPNELYGRESLLKKLTVLAKRKENTEIIGARRFGKTCMLKSMHTLIKKSGDIPVYPVYLDFKIADVHGTEAAYRYMVSELVKSLFIDDVFTQPETIGIQTITPTDDRVEIEEQLSNISATRIQALLERTIRLFAKKMNKTILFMIDEYEYLFKYGLDTPSGFFRLRDLSTDLIDNSLRPFSFWIAGVLDWDELCTDIGSGELNPITAIETLHPIDRSAFSKMWENECDLIEDAEKKKYVLESLEFAYTKSGGVPFYAKQIGAYLMRNDNQPNYSICKSSFKETLNKTMKPAEMNILKSLARKEEHCILSDALTSIKNRGLVVENSDGTYAISIGFLKDYLAAEINNPQQDKMDKDSEAQEISDQIFKLIENINKTQMNLGLDAIFKLPNETISFYKDLANPCYSEEKIQDFCNALYLIYFEWTKKERPRELLPEPYRNDINAQYVDVARHTIGRGHLTDNFVTQPGKASKTDMLVAVTGKFSDPHEPEEIYAFQIAFLNRFKSTLEEIRKHINQNAPNISKAKLKSQRLTGKITSDQNFVVSKKVRYKIDRMFGFTKGYEPNDYYYDDDEEVSFEIKTVKDYHYAIKVRPLKED